MYLYKMLLLAIQPMAIPSLMSETCMVHPSSQAFSLSNNETVVTNLPSTVEFVGTAVEMMEPVDAVPSFDAIQFVKYFAESFAVEVKSAASVAARDFFNEMTFQFHLFGETTHAVMHEFVSDAMIASGPFRLATADVLDEMYVSVEESSDKCRAVAIDFWDAIHLKSEQVYEDLETLVGELPSIAAQSISDIESLVGDTFHIISEECEMAYNELNAIDYSSIISDAVPEVSAAYNRAYAKLESLAFPEPQPAPTSFESIARDALDRIFLGFQRVHDLFTPATPPPPSFWDQPITTTYETLEVIVHGFFFAPPPPPPPRTFESVARDALDAFSVYCQEVYEKLEDYFTGFSFFFFTPPTPPPAPTSSVPSIIAVVELFHFILQEYQARTYKNNKMESSSWNGIGDEEETWTSKYLFDIVLDDDVCGAPFIPNWYYLQYLLDEHKQNGDSLFCFIVSMELDLLPKLLGSDFLCENDDDHLSFAIVMGWNTSTKSNERLADGRPSELFQPTLNCP